MKSQIWLSATLLVAALGLPATAEIAPPDDVAAAPADAETTASGLASKLIEAGSGDTKPTETDWVVVHYSGWTTDGKQFDSSVERGKAVLLPLDAVIDGWTEGLQLMVEGEKRRFWIPEALAYGGQEGKPQGMLVFDIELIELRRVPPAPETVSAPPSDAEVTRSGLAMQVLEAGTGTSKPTKKSTVTVHYTGWTTDGKRFDSSIMRGEPTSFPLNGVIKGWREGLTHMVVGEKRRFWIPEKLAYKGEEGKPQGMLVFDVELISFE